MKRAFDITVAVVGLVVLAPIFIAVAVLVKVSSPGTALFKQERIGRHFRPFVILKFRTMVQNAPNQGGQITFGTDSRVTKVGSLLRKLKIDEIPQLINVLKGEMSLVGPRPEVRRYVDMFREDYEEILQVRPGITDLASIKYRDEAAILGRAENPEEEYVKRVLPEKIEHAKQYVRHASLALDVVIITKTVLKLLTDHLARSSRQTTEH